MKIEHREPTAQEVIADAPALVKRMMARGYVKTSAESNAPRRGRPPGTGQTSHQPPPPNHLAMLLE
jgi:hypothetical protein